mmetsp:Transcript_25686/g.59877  ORF Transcript_25686/g.59877 Transcript_25686/m.59877 type:complete len:333 (+) Transcript_25686:104-1102(+)|eukprot:CAMPEP_0178396534 /NCGR_PEP_ID=MMETSP0689_2-20121128/13778_1 /TAXON_ID=160604 /ORGANISM="Amphidinium massartii, Strain CS-259" /LENGTH=332 /DNA_ID=CAMNT_0020017211 /DNA_START=14 /DNA_END=1012 /DNA_ORIENTATION=-
MALLVGPELSPFVPWKPVAGTLGEAAVHKQHPLRRIARMTFSRNQSRAREARHCGASYCIVGALLLAGAATKKTRRSPRAQVSIRATKADRATEELEAFLRRQRMEPPKVDPLNGKLTEYNDNPIDLFFIAVFRQVMSSVANWQSQLPYWGPQAYEGMLEVAHAMQWGKSLKETEDTSLAVIKGLIPEDGREKFRTALRPDQFGTELNAWITAVFFPFMVGKCDVEKKTQEDVPTIPAGEEWDCAVKIEKCRWLERSGCVGMCVGLCKKPMENMFDEVLGMPLSMEPNMEDLSCTLVFGKKPTPWNEDDLQKQPCFATCATAAKSGTCPKLS